nr:CPBP family intramembrane metalloprotease [Lachnospiraceae bacterium]
GKVGAIFYGILVIAVLLIVESVIQVAGLWPIMQRALQASGGDMDKYQQLYLAEISTSPTIVFTQLAAEVFMIIVAGVWYYLRWYKPAKDEGRIVSVLPELKKPVFWGVVIFGSIAIYSAAAILQIIMANTASEQNELINTGLNAMVGVGALGAIVGSLLAPIAEELTLRGIAMRRAEKSFNLLGCMLLTAILFSVMHLNIIQGVYALPLGLFWGYLSYRYRSVIPSMICHMISNAIGITVMYGLLPDMFQHVPAWAVLLVVFGAITAFFIMKKEKEFKQS